MSPPRAKKVGWAAEIETLRKALAGENARRERAESRVGELETRLAEAGEQQTATSEILRVISSSPIDLQSVMDAVAANAARVCGADDAVIFRIDGDLMRPVAVHGPLAALPLPLTRGSTTGRSIIDRKTVHIEDIAAAPESEFPEGRMAQRHRGHRTTLATPLLREGVPIGAILIRRMEVRPFTDKQISLLQTFADQAVIAIENTRLFNETKDALDQQTATSEILRVISSSPTDVQPVFETIAARAKRLCDARECAVFRFDGELIHLVAQADTGAAWANALRSAFPRPPGRGSITARAIQTRSLVHVPDVLADPEFELTEAARASGVRTTLSIPMVREGEVIGAITVDRGEPKPFLDKQVALVQTFADQAVIAIENVRLFTELQEKNRALTEAHAQVTESLERQTATAEILRVISSSPTTVQPVFDAVVRNGARLCEAANASLHVREGDVMRKVAEFGRVSTRLTVGATRPITRTTVSGRAIIDRRTINIGDLHAAEIGREYPESRHIPETRACLGIPLLRERGEAVGALFIFRTEGRPFTDNEIALLQTFADQAVIAIENARLFNELQEKNQALTTAHAQVTGALEQQTATSEILGVISRSPSDVQPVFDTIVGSATRLCHAVMASVLLTDGQMLYLPANYGSSPEALSAVRARFPRPLDRQTLSGAAILARSVVHVPDVQEPSVPEFTRQSGEVLGYRSLVAVPMLREGEVVGALNVCRREPGPFSDAEVELLKTFADQAVIAIENVRLFRELETRNAELTTALERQTATSEILRVISGAQQDAQAVFDTIVQSAVRLCRATTAAVFRVEDGVIYHPANYGGDPEALAAARARYPRPVDSQTMPGMIVLARTVVQIPDSEEVGLPDHVRQVGRILGFRSVVGVPMLREGEAVGALLVTRREPGRFSDPEVELLKTFSDQAVIAIENVRLFTELQDKNRTITEALNQQTATADILRVISSSPTDVQPVFDTIVDSAARLCQAAFATLHRFDGQILTFEAQHGMREAQLEQARHNFPEPAGRHMAVGRAVLDRRLAHIHDIREDQEYLVRSHQEDYRTVLAVPLMREGVPVGALGLWRREVQPFSDQQIELVKTFADQAVIAIENVRLFKELEARTDELTRSVEQLTALGEVGRAVSSTLDLEAVLTTIVSRAVQLSGLDGGVVFEYDEGAEEFVLRVATETGGALAEARRTTRIRKGEGVLGRTAITLEPVQVPDITVPGAYEGRLRENLIESGIRAVLAVPMVYEGQLIGCLGVTRNQPGDFPGEIIELLRTFATQSALAIQNARLFHEIEVKGRQLEAASQHKSEFLANMSHELRTPLNAIIGFSEVLGERLFGDLNAKQEEYLKDIHASGQHLLSLINDILDLSKIEAGRMELELTDFHLPTALDNALTLVRERAGRRGIVLHVTSDQRLDYVRADERKVRQVVLNLLSNAIKFTPEGGRIEVRAKQVDGSVEIAVSDTGVGIAPEDQEAIFEEFRQVGTTDKKVEGTGLGLALSRKFVELHGGRIWVESEVGAGATFTFTLPRGLA